MRRITVEALGCVVALEMGVEVGPDLEADLRAAWRDASTRSQQADATVLLGHPGHPGSFQVADERALASEISSAVTEAAITTVRGTGLLLHAAGLADDDGRVVAFVAASGGGKTTLSSKLGRTFGYVSDETVLVEPSLEIRPYRKPLSMIEPEHHIKRQVAPSELHLRELPGKPLRLAGLVLIDRRPDAPAEPTLSEVSLADAVMLVTPQLSFAGDGQTLQRLAAASDAIGGVKQLSYRDDSDLVPAVRAVLEGSRPAPTPWEVDVAVPHRLLRPGEWARGDAANALWTDGRLLVQANATIHELSGIGALIWNELAEGPRSEDGIAEIVTAAAGATGTPALEALRPQLAQLSEARVLDHG